ncbi:unnamed protein product [Effrenium voratum]|nr:unnamed protein product [Effrenium voratum]
MRIARADAGHAVLTHTIPCSWEEGGDGKTRTVTLGSLDWKAVSLGEKTIDLEVSVLVRAEDSSEPPMVHVLKAKDSGKSFAGRFAPAEDPRLSEGGLAALESVVFEFDNSYSWWTEKEVELIFVRGASTQLPPPLPQMAPHGLPPRAAGNSKEVEAQEIPDLRKAAEDTNGDSKKVAFRFIEHLEMLLDTAEAQCPKEGLRLVAEPLLSELQKLRQSCKELGGALAEGLSWAFWALLGGSLANLRLV